MAFNVLLTLLGGSLMPNLLRAAEKDPYWYSLLHPDTLWHEFGFILFSWYSKLLNGYLLADFRRNDCCKPALDRGFPFWPFSLSDAWLALGANRASKTTSKTDSELPKSRFRLSRHFCGDFRWVMWQGDVAGWRGRVTSRWLEGTEGGFQFTSHHLCAVGSLGGGGSATAERVTCGGSTTGKLPISRMLTIGKYGGGKTQPPLISSADDRTAGGTGKAVEG